MYTEADKRRDEAEQHIVEAIKCLNQIVIDQISGSRDYKPEYRAELYVILKELIDLKQRF